MVSGALGSRRVIRRPQLSLLWFWGANLGRGIPQTRKSPIARQAQVSSPSATRNLGHQPNLQQSNVPALAGNFLAGLHWKRHGAANCSFKMISFPNIRKQNGKQLLFVDASFQLNPGEKVGLAGPNGAGKTTLFRRLAGEGGLCPQEVDDRLLSPGRRGNAGLFGSR